MRPLLGNEFIAAIAMLGNGDPESGEERTRGYEDNAAKDDRGQTSSSLTYAPKLPFNQTTLNPIGCIERLQHQEGDILNPIFEGLPLRHRPLEKPGA